MMRPKSLLIAFILFLIIGCNTAKKQESYPEYNDQLLQKVRIAAAAIPGNRPVSIGFLKYAESIRKWSDVIEGGSSEPCKMARTVFQVRYPDGSIMVDAGMDRDVHHFFEKEKPQPFDDTKASIVRQAIESARLIVITHEHGDHVGNAIRMTDNSIPQKTILTKAQVNTLMSNPQMPEIKLDEAKSKMYIVADLESVLPVAPGLVLIKAPGHTNGEIMIYVKLDNGKEYMFTGDVAWTIRGIAEKKQKPKSEIKRIGEDPDLIGKQLNWLNDLMNKEKITMLVSHDDITLSQYAAQGIISDSLQLSK